MSNLTTRAGKGSPLTNNELDANFTNLNADKVEIGGDLSGTPTAPIVTKVQGQSFSSAAANVGEKLVWNGTAWAPATDPSGEPIGHADKSESSIGFNAGTRTFTISPVSASFVVWCKGVKHTYTSAQTVVIPNTTGLHFIYFNASGVLSTQMTYFTWEEHAPTAYIYWNATTQQAVYFGDERHGITLDWQTHEYLHRTRGAAIASGFAASGYTTTGIGATDADAQIDVAGGTFFDEDMQVDIVSTNTPVAGTWQQDLSGPALIPVLYLSGSAWVIDAPTNFPFKVVSGVPQYNLYSGGSWSTAPVANNEYFVSWILATNNLTYPVIAVISQALTNQLSTAEAMTFEGLNLNGFPSVEFRPLYKVIYQYKSGFTNSIKASTISVYDLRSLQSAGVAAALVQDHGNLSGLGDDDHAQYLHVSEVRTPSSAVKNSFLPSQTSNNGKYLTTDGINPSWGDVPSGSLTFTGDVTGTGNTGSSTTLTLANSGVTAGTFTKVTVDTKGRVTTGASISNTDVTTALGFTPESSANKGVAGGYASLDGGGKVPSTQLPSYVDDVLEYANLATFPATGETGKIYIAIDTVKTYRWSGSAYVEITSSPGSTDAVPEGSTNLYFTNARARAAVGASGSLSYSTATGIFSYTQPTNVSAFTNDSGYLTGITGAQVTSALGYTPYNATNPSGYTNNTGTVTSVSGTGTVSGLTLTGTVTGSGSLTLGGTLSLTSGQVTTALGYTPYNSSNPSGYITSSSNITGNAATATTASQLNGYFSSSYSGPTSAVKQFFWDNLSANGGQARTFEIARLGIDYNDWNTGIGPFEVELYEAYYSRGLKKKYVIYWGYSNVYGMQLVEYSGNGDNNFQVRIGTPVQVSGDNYYLPVFVDVRYYSYVDVRVTTNRDITASNPPGIGSTYINAAPSATNISDFTADSTVNFASTTAVQINGNQLLHAGNYNDYAPSRTGGSASGTWGINITGSAGSADQIDGWAFRNTGSNAGVNADTIESNGITYYTAGVPNFSGNSTDGALYSQMYSSSWQHQIAADYRSGQIALRGKNNGTWQSWRTVLDSGNYSSYALPLSGGTLSGAITVTGGTNSIIAQDNGGSGDWRGRIISRNSTYDRAAFLGNYQGIAGVFAHNHALNAWADLYVNTVDGSGGGTVRMPSSVLINGNQVLHAGNYTSYSPSLTGSGASGMWGISITGSAGSATTATRSTIEDTRAAQRTPNNYDDYRASYEFTDRITGLGDWHTAFTMQGWNDGYAAWQIIGPASTSAHENFYLRSGVNTTWNSVRTILHSGNYNSYALPLSGGTITGTALQVGTAFTYDNPGGWNANIVAAGTNHARVRIRATSYNGSGDRETYLWLDNTVSPATGLFSSASTFNFNGSIGTVQVAGNAILHAGNYSSYFKTVNGSSIIGSGNISVSASVNWDAVGAGTRTGYGDIRFQPPASSYAGIQFLDSGGNAAGWMLIRGTSDTDVYTAEGITIVADKGWLSLAQRESAGKGVRLMSGATSTERLKITTAGDIQFVNGNSFTYGGNAILHAGNYTNYFTYNTWNDWLRENGDDGQFKIYGNTRTLIFRTDDSNNPHGGGGYSAIWYHGGSADGNRRMILGTSGDLWTNSYGWLHDYYASYSTANSRYSRKDTTNQWIRPYYEYGSYLTSETPSNLTSQMGGGGLRVDFLHPSYTGSGGWNHVITWSGYNFYNAYQLGGHYDGGTGTDLWVRSEANHGGSSWTAWRKLLNSSNYSSYALPLSGGTLTGDVVYTNLKFTSDQNYGLYGRNGYLDTVNGRGSDPLELNYYDGGDVKIGSGGNGSKALYASGVYDAGSRALSQQGSSYYQVTTWLQSTGSHFLYAPSSGAGTHWNPGATTYGSWRMEGYANGYQGVEFYNTSGPCKVMYDTGGNGGFYDHQDWQTYWYRPNRCMGIGTSSTSSSYKCYVGGALYATDNIVAYSDSRVKENVVTISNALDIVKNLRGVYYNRIDDPTKKLQVGFIAQEVAAVDGAAPLVTYAKDVDQYGVSYGNTVAILVEAIKELSANVSRLQSEIDAIRSGQQ